MPSVKAGLVAIIWTMVTTFALIIGFLIGNNFLIGMTAGAWATAIVFRYVIIWIVDELAPEEHIFRGGGPVG